MRKSDIYNNVLLLLAFLMPSFLFAQNSVKPQYTIDGNGFECFNGANNTPEHFIVEPPAIG